MDAPLQLKRHSEPSKIDVAPYMSTCTVNSNKETVDLYVQRNIDDMDPKWEYVTGVSIKVTEQEIQQIISKRYMV